MLRSTMTHLPQRRLFNYQLSKWNSRCKIFLNNNNKFNNKMDSFRIASALVLKLDRSFKDIMLMQSGQPTGEYSPTTYSKWCPPSWSPSRWSHRCKRIISPQSARRKWVWQLKSQVSFMSKIWLLIRSSTQWWRRNRWPRWLSGSPS